MEVFRDDDAGYLAWLADHPAGLVCNVHRSPRSAELVLHRSGCRTINGQPTRGDVWTGQYIKVCAEWKAPINFWARRNAGTEPRPCRICGP